MDPPIGDDDGLEGRRDEGWRSTGKKDEKGASRRRLIESGSKNRKKLRFQMCSVSSQVVSGTEGQVLGNLFFLVADHPGHGWWTTEPAMKAAMADPTFTLEHCKEDVEYLTVHMAGLMGEVDPPNVPAPWLNPLPTLAILSDIVDSLGHS